MKNFSLKLKVVTVNIMLVCLQYLQDLQNIPTRIVDWLFGWMN